MIETEAVPERVCETCCEPMPPGKRSHARYCGAKCRNAARGRRAEKRPLRVPPAPIGQRFGRLVVTGPEVRVPHGPGKTRRGVVCLCDCGTTGNVALAQLLNGNSRSCGCLKRETSARNAQSPARLTAATAAHRTHGLSHHPLYSTWKSMLHRCEVATDPSYRNYGGRGISVCPEWHDIAAFAAWIDANLGPRPDSMTLDRIDNDGNYEPGNVRWATATEQMLNQRRSRAAA